MYEKEKVVRTEYLTQNFLETIDIGGRKVEVLQPPVGADVWNGRVRLDLCGGGTAYIGASFRKRQDKLASGDMIQAFRYQVKDKNGRGLADVIGIMAIDGLSCADEEGHLANVKKYKPALEKIFNGAPWENPDAIIALQQRLLFNSNHFEEFIDRTDNLIIDASKDRFVPKEWDLTGGLKDVPLQISKELMKAQSLNAVDLYFQLSNAYNKSHPTVVAAWNYRAVPGQLVFIVPNKNIIKWPDYVDILGARTQAGADVLALPFDGEHPRGNVNMFIDLLIDRERERLKSENLPLSDINKFLERKLEEVFYAFGANYGEIDFNIHDHINAAKLIEYPMLVSSGGVVMTDGAQTKNYRIVDEMKSLEVCVQEGIQLTDPSLPVDKLDQLLTAQGFNKDDRAIIAVNFS